MNRRQWNRKIRSLIGPATIDGGRRHAHQIAEMLDVLPDAIFRKGASELWQQVGIDAFFSYARTLIEFLMVRPTGDDGDLTAHDVLGTTTWLPDYQADPRLHERLLTVWDLSSKQQGHFSIGRAAALVMGRPELDEIADDVLTIWDQFAQTANHPDTPTRANFNMYREAPSGLANRICKWLRRR
ncbi:hypothetical protein [Mycolicibacterium helvum]|uniref:hypothetical protein n=1 Tax=Mycolicibacterium helvum TaxID=1534349 RepID=UPI0013D84151|nr:hypothetical protein [Mycolicibacterium helvum]